MLLPFQEIIISIYTCFCFLVFASFSCYLFSLFLKHCNSVIRRRKTKMASTKYVVVNFIMLLETPQKNLTSFSQEKIRHFYTVINNNQKNVNLPGPGSWICLFPSQ